MEEIWKDVPNFEGIYQVSNLGNVRSYERLDSRGARQKARPKKPSLTYKGYLRVSVSKPNFSQTPFVHKLVLNAFIGPTPFGKQINHKNGNRADNRLENLEYVTPHENSLHAFRYGRRRSNITGEKHWASKLVANEVKAIRLLYGTGKYTQTQLADMFGVLQSSIGKIIHRSKWKHI